MNMYIYTKHIYYIYVQYTYYYGMYNIMLSISLFPAIVGTHSY